MKEFLLQNINARKILTLTFVFALIFGVTRNSEAQPEIPRLSLTGVDQGYYEDWYPDGRLWTPVAHNGDREIYVPIFIENKWETVLQDFEGRDTAIFVAEPIKSFQFSLLYHKEALEPVDIVTEHPAHFVELELPGTEVPCDAEGFDVKMDYQFSDRYWDYLRPTVPAADSINGMALTITGVSTNRTLPTHSDFRILCYVKYKVVPTIKTSNISAGAQESPIIIDNDVIRYNDLNVCKERPFFAQRAYFDDPVNSYDTWYPPLPDPPQNFHNVDRNLGLLPYTPFFAGMSNFARPNSENLDNPILPGVIYVNIMTKSQFPELQFSINRGIGQVPAVQPITSIYDDYLEEVVDIEWEITDPITSDASTGEVERLVELQNKNSGGIAQFIEVTTDEPWLEVETDAALGRRLINPSSRDGFIDYLQNGVLSSSNQDDQYNNLDDDPGIFLKVICNPENIDANGTEENGIYTGYVTFKSDNLLNSPVRLKVTFIYFKEADEGTGVAGSTSGITLNIKNSAAVVQETSIVFGTSERGTNGVDSLYGEFARESELQGFGARFYPLDQDGNPLKDWTGEDLSANLINNGFGDFKATDENPYTGSRDIRSNEAGRSIIYYVKFDEDGQQNYPVVVEWNVEEFLDGSELFIRDTDNGQSFPSVNMREANPLSRPGDWRSFTIQDQEVNSFLIEYTLPETIEYIDENGDPIIKKGWNFLSLPVKPVNTTWNIMYPNTTTIPWFFNNSNYQQPVDGILQEGIGYFMKYGNQVDIEFAGTFISEISTDRNNAPRVYPGDGDFGGWNTIGALSCPVSIDEIQFEPFAGNTLPDIDYTLENGVWRYNTNRGYEEVSQLLPGLGYWIKVDSDGYYKLDPDNLVCSRDKLGVVASTNPRAEIYNSSTKLELKDNAQHAASLYMTNDNNVNIANFEMPPVPPTGIFDVRFAENTRLTNENKTTINLQGVEFPAVMNIVNADKDYTFANAMTGEVIGKVSKGMSASIELNDDIKAISVNRTESEALTFGLNVYPNPVVNETANIQYTIENTNLVNISVYDMLGNEVMTIVNDNVEAGSYNSTFNVNALSNGHYIVRLTSGNNTSVSKIEVVK